jgi:hypothetical protein
MKAYRCPNAKDTGSPRPDGIRKEKFPKIERTAKRVRLDYADSFLKRLTSGSAKGREVIKSIADPGLTGRGYTPAAGLRFFGHDLPLVCAGLFQHSLP